MSVGLTDATSWFLHGTMADAVTVAPTRSSPASEHIDPMPWKIHSTWASSHFQMSFLFLI